MEIEYCDFCRIKFEDNEQNEKLHKVHVVEKDRSYGSTIIVHRKCFEANNFNYRLVSEAKGESVNHPAHYGGADNPYEAIKIIEHYKLGFCLGNTIKYILRAGKKDSQKYVEDLEKAKWYLERKINQLKNENNK